MDMISNLPDEILYLILNLLPIKEAASTSLLAKRWRNLFAFTPDLDLCFIESVIRNPNGGKNFMSFVNRVLAVSGNSPKRKFSLRIRQRFGPPYTNRLINKVLSRGILELDLDMLTGDVPLDIFYSKILVRLKLGRRFYITSIPENASLPALKTLNLQSILFTHCTFEALISACPVLEELTVLGDPWYYKDHTSHTISSPTLKRLVFACKSTAYSDFPLTRKISFDTPNLAYLEYSDKDTVEYPIVNLNSLVEANLELDMVRSLSERNPRNLIKGLRNVEILKLSSVETLEVLYYFAEAIPLFENLSRLSITTKSGQCWRLMPLLIKKAPNLETLVINGPLHFYYDYGPICECLSDYSFLSTCSVKVLEIKEYWGYKGDFEQTKQIMKKLTCLELVIVHVRKMAKESSARDLQRLPKPCKIQIQIKYLSL